MRINGTIEIDSGYAASLLRDRDAHGRIALLLREQHGVEVDDPALIIAGLEDLLTVALLARQERKA